MTVEELRAKLSAFEPTEAIYADLTPQTFLPLNDCSLIPKIGWRLEPFSRSAGWGTTLLLAFSPERLRMRRVQVRVAVAAAVAQRPITLPDNALVKLLQDQDVGVRKFATLAVKPENGNEPRALLNRLSSEDAIPQIRQNATEALRKLR